MREFAKFLYTHNPFYLLSAGCVSYGLRVAFYEEGAEWINAWLLAQSLAAYTLLLAVTACIVVRVGKVWDDARTIALLVVLMSVSISVSFDALAMNDNAAARQVLTCGWLFSVVMVEGLVLGLGVRFPLLFRLPLYALFCLFFFYPLVLGHSVWVVDKLTMSWRVFYFPLLAALLTLTLIPAARRGPTLTAQNGSPWRWPYYPWSVFAFLALGICGRSYLMTVSFQTDQGLESSFGLYYLVPLGFSILFLVAEIAIAGHHHRLARWLTWAPFGLVLLASWHVSEGVYRQFLAEFTGTWGSPLWLAVLAGVGFNLLQWLRRVPGASHGVAWLVVLLGFVDSKTLGIHQLQPVSAWPLVAVGGYHLYRLWGDSTALRWMKAWTTLVGAACITGWESAFMMHGGILPVHLMVFAAITGGLAFDDRLALWLRKMSPILVAAMATGAAGLGWTQADRLWPATGYVAALAGGALLWWGWCRLRLWKWSAIACSAVLAAILMVGGIKNLHHYFPQRAIQALVLGAGCFVTGGLISTLKSGLGGRSPSFFQREWRLLAGEWGSPRRSDGEG